MNKLGSTIATGYCGTCGAELQFDQAEKEYLCKSHPGSDFDVKSAPSVQVTIETNQNQHHTGDTDTTVNATIAPGQEETFLRKSIEQLSALDMSEVDPLRNSMEGKKLRATFAINAYEIVIYDIVDPS